MEYCTATTVGDRVKSTRNFSGTPAAASWSVASFSMRAMRSFILVRTISAVGPLACTINEDSGKLCAHWPPVSGWKTAQPS